MTFLHNTETAGAVLGECDAALFVLSADPPITEVEVKYLRDVQKLIPKIFFILNKVDLLDAGERTLAEKFLADVLTGQAGISPTVQIFCVSARRGLRAKQDLITRMFPLSRKALKTLANFRATVMAGLDPRLSGLFFWHWRMALILLRSGRLATIWTRKGQCHAA